MNDEQLKPCPFCGKPGKTSKLLINSAWCSDEMCPGFDISATKKDWNTRPLEDALLAEVERLKAALETIANDCKPRVDTDGRLLDASPIKFPNRSLIGYYARRVLERAE